MVSSRSIHAATQSNIDRNIHIIYRHPKFPHVTTNGSYRVTYHSRGTLNDTYLPHYVSTRYLTFLPIIHNAGSSPPLLCMVTSPVRYTLLRENNTHCIPTHRKCDLHSRWPTRITYHDYDFDARTYLQNTRYATTIARYALHGVTPSVSTTSDKPVPFASCLPFSVSEVTDTPYCLNC